MGGGWLIVVQVYDCVRMTATNHACTRDGCITATWHLIHKRGYVSIDKGRSMEASANSVISSNEAMESVRVTKDLSIKR